MTEQHSLTEDEVAQWLEYLRSGTREEKLSARLQLAEVCRSRGMVGEAVELLELNVRDGVSDPSLFRQLATCYRDVGRHVDAHEADNQADELELAALRQRTKDPSEEYSQSDRDGNSKRSLFQALYGGRLNVRSYIVGYVIFIIFLAISYKITELLPKSISDVSNIIILIIFWFSLASLTIRRLHDLGHSGWMMLFSVIPILGFLLALYLLFPGKNESNKFGQSTHGSFRITKILGIYRDKVE